MEPSGWGFGMRGSRATCPSCPGHIDDRLMAAILQQSKVTNPVHTLQGPRNNGVPLKGL